MTARMPSMPAADAASDRFRRARTSSVAVLTVAILPSLFGGPAVATFAPRLERGHLAMREPGRQPLLISYYEQLLKKRDTDAFRDRVEARYSEATLCRLVHATDTQARRAAVTALGLFGSFEANATLASALRDDDPVVRDLAVQSMWSVWFRADSPENNERLQEVADLIGLGRYTEAERMATRLITRAPDFAEAYNQRAIAYFNMGRYADSAADCQRALDRNPYHFGALSGLGQCYLRLNLLDQALDVFRRAAELQPHDEGLRQAILDLEDGIP